MFIIAGIVPLSTLIAGAPDANAECLDEQPPIWVTRQEKNYFNIYSAWIDVDDHVPISGIVRLDVINEERYGDKVLIEIINDGNGTMVKSDYAPLNVTDGSFVYNFSLWIDDSADDPFARPPHDRYIVRATYGLYQHDWNFFLTPSVPDGLPEFSARSTVPVNVTAGEQIEITIDMQNNKQVPLKEWPFLALIDVRDSSEVTIYLAWQSGYLISGCNTEFAFSWVAEKEGEYEVRAMALSGFPDPRFISEVRSIELLVTGTA